MLLKWFSQDKNRAESAKGTPRMASVARGSVSRVCANKEKRRWKANTRRAFQEALSARYINMVQSVQCVRTAQLWFGQSSHYNCHLQLGTSCMIVAYQSHLLSAFGSLTSIRISRLEPIQCASRIEASKQSQRFQIRFTSLAEESGSQPASVIRNVPWGITPKGSISVMHWFSRAI